MPGRGMAPLGPDDRERAENLAREAAERAARLATERAKKDQQQAIDRAIRDANVDRDIHEHSLHLEQINGSQREAAASLVRLETDVAALRTDFTLQTKIQEALAVSIQKRSGRSFTRFQVVMGVAMAASAYFSLILLLVSHA
jgi:hypothetical protein